MSVMVGFVVYCMLLGAILCGVYCYARPKASVPMEPDAGIATPDIAHFALGNRSIHYVATALSAHASDMSDWLFMAYPAVIYGIGMEQAWISVALVIGMFLNWKFVAPRLRRETERYNALTLSTYFEKRFNDNSGIMRMVTAALITFFFIVYIAAGLKGIGFLLESAFHIPYLYAIMCATFLVCTYTAVGGFIGIAWLDSFQALFLLCVLVFVPCYAWFYIDGISSIVQAARLNHVSLRFLPHSFADGFAIFMTMMTWMPGYCAMPHILTKFMGTRNADELNKAQYIGIAWQILVLSAATAVGLIGLSFFTVPLVNKELIFVEMVKALFYPPLAGLMLCAIFAATLSTIDSQLLVIATTLTEDIYLRIPRIQHLATRRVLLSRITLCIVSLFALYVASDQTSTIQSLVRYCWTGLFCSFGPLVLAALYNKKTTIRGALASVVLGGVTGIVWEYGTPFIAGYTGPSTIPGFIVGWLATQW